MVDDDYQAVTDYGKAVQQLADSTDSAANAFAQAAEGSKAWTMASRILSGSGLWKLQNYVRAVGNAINIFNNNSKEAELKSIKQMETTMALSETYTNLSKSIEAAKNKTGGFYEMLMMMDDKLTEDEGAKLAESRLSEMRDRIGERIALISGKGNEEGLFRKYLRPAKEGEERSRFGYTGDVINAFMGNKLFKGLGKAAGGAFKFFRGENKTARAREFITKTFRNILPIITNGVRLFFASLVPALLAGLSVLAGVALQVVLYIAGILAAMVVVVKIIRAMELGKVLSEVLEKLRAAEFILGGLKDITSGLWKLLTAVFEGNFSKFFGALYQILLGVGQLLVGVVVTAIGVVGSLIIGAFKAIPNLIGQAIKKVVSLRANGGYANGLTVVGERGPELLSLPRGSRVFSNAQSQRMSGGGGASDSEIRDIANKVAREVNLRMNRTGSAVGRF